MPIRLFIIFLPMREKGVKLIHSVLIIDCSKPLLLNGYSESLCDISFTTCICQGAIIWLLWLMT